MAPRSAPGAPSRRARFTSNLSVRQKITGAAAVIIVVSTALLAVVSSSMASTMAENDADRYVAEVARSGSAVVETRIGNSMRLAEQFGHMFEQLKASGVTDRAVYDSLLKNALEQHPDLLGAWTLWEPNALDGRDAALANTTGTDATGRYIPYWNRAGGSIELIPLVDYEKPGAGDYYLVPKQTRAEKVLEPYEYQIGNEMVLMTSVAVPMTDASGTFLGVTGFDIKLTDLQAAIGEIKPLGGYAALVTTGGLLAAHPTPELVTKEPDASLAAAVERVRGDASASVARGHDSVLGTDGLTGLVTVPVGAKDTWVLAVTVPRSAALAKATSLRTRSLLLALGLLVVTVIAMMLVVGRLTRPLRRLQDRLAEIADGDGDLTQRLDDSRHDEIGLAAAAFNRFATRIGDLLQSVSACMQRLATASSELDRLSQQLHHTATGTEEKAGHADEATAEVSTIVDSVAAAAQEMSASINEVAGNAARAAGIADAAVESVRRTGDTVARLEKVGTEIDEIVRTITSIAEQTNLLALNATIEAARAGESGKGFAVVANEVKELAQQTGAATESIAGKVTGIQQAAREATEALGTISDIVQQVNDVQTTIAAAVEEQSSTSAEMTRSLAGVAGGTRDIAGTMASLASATGQARSVAAETQSSGSDVREVVDELDRLLRGFRY